MVVPRLPKEKREEISPEKASEGLQNMLRFFPEECMPLLILLLQGNLNDEQVVATAKFFYVLSFNAPLRSFIPHCILHDLKTFLESNEIECEAFKALLMHRNWECSLVGPFLHAFYF